MLAWCWWGTHILAHQSAANPAGGAAAQAIGDKGVDSDKLRKELEDLGHQACFPAKKNRRRKAAYSKSFIVRGIAWRTSFAASSVGPACRCDVTSSPCKPS